MPNRYKTIHDLITVLEQECSYYIHQGDEEGKERSANLRDMIDIINSSLDRFNKNTQGIINEQLKTAKEKYQEVLSLNTALTNSEINSLSEKIFLKFLDKESRESVKKGYQVRSEIVSASMEIAKSYIETRNDILKRK